MTIPPETRARLRRLDRLATKGPWVASEHLERIITVETGEKEVYDRRDIAQLSIDKARSRLRVESDAALIATMRNNIIPLLDALEAAEAELDRLREALRMVVAYAPRPHQDDWLNPDAFEGYRAAYRTARAALGEQP